MTAFSTMAAPPTSARAIWRSTCRSPGTSSSMPTAVIRRPTTSTSAAIVLSDGAARRRRWPAPIRTIRALADLKGKLPNTAVPDRRYRRRRRLCRRRRSISACRSAATTEIWRSDPLLARSRRSSPKQPTIDAHQTRYDVRAEVPLSGFFSQVRLRGGYSKYHHDELDAGRRRSTRASSARAARAGSISSRPTRSGWGGTSGAQYFDRNVHLRGEEKFLPDANQSQAGLFTLQTLVRGPLAARGRRARRIEPSSTPMPTRRSGRPRFVARNSRPCPGSLGAQLRCRRRHGAPGCRSRTASARRRSRNCSPTDRTAAASPSRSAIPI